MRKTDTSAERAHDIIDLSMLLPMTICGFLANTKDWDIISIPPTITAGTEVKQVKNTEPEKDLCTRPPQTS